MWPLHPTRPNAIIWGNPAAELRRQQESLDRFRTFLRELREIFTGKRQSCHQ